MSQKELTLNKLAPGLFEVTRRGVYGLAKLQDGVWDISPNMQKHKEPVLKAILEATGEQQE